MKLLFSCKHKVANLKTGAEAGMKGKAPPFGEFHQLFKAICIATPLLVSNPFVNVAVSSNEQLVSAAAPAGASAQRIKDQATFQEAYDLVKKYSLYQDKVGLLQNSVQGYEQQLTGNEKKDFARINSFLSPLEDKYTRLVDPESFQKLIKFDILGVGMLLAPDPLTREMTVTSPPIPGSAAAGADIHKGDKILSVNGNILKVSICNRSYLC